MSQLYQNILYVSQGLYGEEESLTQAVSLVQHTKAKLTVLIHYPSMPANLKDYKEFYQQSLINAFNKMLDTALSNCEFTKTGLDKNLTLEVESNDKIVVSIIKRVLNNKHDLVIKNAKANDDNMGLKSVDMNLLRKCPVPVWLCHPLKSHHSFKKIAVAIDPETPEKSGVSLSERLLQTAATLSEKYHAELHIVSCWVYAFEDILRKNLPTAPTQEVDKLVLELKNSHLAKLQEIINKSGIKAEYQIQHIKGTAEHMIPLFIDQQNIDLLVMGTIERKWLDKFLMGNTAEDILRKLTCSLLAMKPNGFISPYQD